MTPVSKWAPACLVLLRTLIGWHFLYEGYFKLIQPAWSAAGAPLPPWSAAGFLRAASGPLAGAFHRMAEPPWISIVDVAIPVALAVIGVWLMLGLFTQWAAAGALLLLLTFYIAAVPTTGEPELRSEGAYLIVNKTLIEAGAVLVVLLSRTGRIAGLDRMLSKRAPMTRESGAAA